MGTALRDKFYGCICGCSKRTLRKNADGVYHAFKNRLKKEREYAEMMDIE